MKQIICIILLSRFLLAGSYFEKLYTKDLGDLHSIASLNDGSFVLSSLTKEGTLKIIKTNKEGAIEFEKNYEGYITSKIESHRSVVLVADSSYLLLGSFMENGKANLKLLKISLNGDSLWERSYSESSDYYSKYLIPVSSGGFLIGAFSGGFADIIRINDFGEIIWKTKIPIPSRLNYEFDIIESANNEYLFLIKGIIYKMNSDGIVVWEKNLNEELYHIQQDGEGNIHLSGNNVYIKTDSLGNIIIKNEILQVVKDMFLLEDKIILCGSGGQIILHLDLSGQIIFEDNDKDASFNNIIKAVDGGIVFFGEIRLREENRITIFNRILKTERNGHYKVLQLITASDIDRRFVAGKNYDLLWRSKNIDKINVTIYNDCQSENIFKK